MSHDRIGDVGVGQFPRTQTQQDLMDENKRLRALLQRWLAVAGAWDIGMRIIDDTMDALR